MNELSLSKRATDAMPGRRDGGHGLETAGVPGGASKKGATPGRGRKAPTAPARVTGGFPAGGRSAGRGAGELRALRQRAPSVGARRHRAGSSAPAAAAVGGAGGAGSGGWGRLGGAPPQPPPKPQVPAVKEDCPGRGCWGNLARCRRWVCGAGGFGLVWSFFVSF